MPDWNRDKLIAECDLYTLEALRLYASRRYEHSSGIISRNKWSAHMTWLGSLIGRAEEIRTMSQVASEASAPLQSAGTASDGFTKEAGVFMVPLPVVDETPGEKMEDALRHENEALRRRVNLIESSLREAQEAVNKAQGATEAALKGQKALYVAAHAEAETTKKVLRRTQQALSRAEASKRRAREQLDELNAAQGIRVANTAKRIAATIAGTCNAKSANKGAPYMRYSPEDWMDHAEAVVRSLYSPDEPERPTTGLNFGQALEWLREGKRIQRAAWAPATWLAHQPARRANMAQDPALMELAPGLPFATRVNEFIVLISLRGEISPWVPTSDSLLAKDWLATASGGA